ncbi:MAG: DUF58 domain-containing protein [Verrucomicrobiota bacterium]
MASSDSKVSPLGRYRYLHRNYRTYHAIKMWFTRRFTAAGLMVLLGILISAALGLDTNASMAYQAFVLLSLLLLAAAFSCRFLRVPFDARRALPRFGSAGQPMPYRVTIRNRTARVQAGLAVFDDLGDPCPTLEEFASTPEPGEEKRNWFDRRQGFYRWSWLVEQNQRGTVKERSLAALPPKGEIEVNMELLPVRRGVLRFESVSLACPDPFGLFRSFVSVPLPDKVLILPRRYAVSSVALPGTLKYQQGGVAMAAAVGESEEFVSLRDYRPGDPMRRIHWRSWAKTGMPIVKEFQDEFFVRHALILDTFSDVAYSDNFEEAVSVAASFACSIQTQDSLLDLMFVGPQAYCFTAGRGLAHIEQMLEILASVKACRDNSFDTLSRLVLEHSQNVSGCICIFLAWDKPRRDLVGQLKAMGLPLRVFVIVDKGSELKLDPGPLADEPMSFHQLEVGKIAEALARL